MATLFVKDQENTAALEADRNPGQEDFNMVCHPTTDIERISESDGQSKSPRNWPENYIQYIVIGVLFIAGAYVINWLYNNGVPVPTAKTWSKFIYDITIGSVVSVPELALSFFGFRLFDKQWAAVTAAETRARHEEQKVANDDPEAGTTQQERLELARASVREAKLAAKRAVRSVCIHSASLAVGGGFTLFVVTDLSRIMSRYWIQIAILNVDKKDLKVKSWHVESERLFPPGDPCLHSLAVSMRVWCVRFL